MTSSGVLGGNELIPRFGKTALHKAVKFRNLGMVMAILGDERMNVNGVDKFGLTALHIACIPKNMDENVLRALLSCPRLDVNLVPPKLDSGNTPLHIASIWGNRAAVEEFIKHSDIQPDLTNAQGETALHISAVSGHYEIVKVLIDSGADVFIKRHSDNLTPLELVISRNSIRKYGHIIRLLQDAEQLVYVLK